MFGLFKRKCRQCGRPLADIVRSDDRIDDLMKRSALGSATRTDNMCAGCRSQASVSALPLSYGPVTEDIPDPAPVEQQSAPATRTPASISVPKTAEAPQDYVPGDGYKSEVELDSKDADLSGETLANSDLVEKYPLAKFFLGTKTGRNLLVIPIVLFVVYAKSCSSQDQANVPYEPPAETIVQPPEEIAQSVETKSDVPASEPAAAVAFRPTPIASPGNWVTTNDYPVRALSQAREGTTSFRLEVSTSGKVTNCSVTISSGHKDLDDATCKALSRRARFEPAVDYQGKRVASMWSNRVRWQIPR
jgi:TonB family protein